MLKYIQYYFIFIFLLKISLSISSCIIGENHCSKCNPITKLCVKCEENIYIPDQKGGCENAKKCIMGNNQCIECNEMGNVCKKCIEGYFPDENGGCSYTDNCEISFEGKCLKCKENFILIGLNVTFIEGIKICKSLISGDLKNCEKIDTEQGYCEECKEGFYLNEGDKKCTNIENCSKSVFDICIKCNNGYYLDKRQNKCIFQEGIFRHCIQTIDGKNCDICEEDYYFDKNNICVGVNFCELSAGNYRCQKCISGYYLSDYGNTCTPEKNCNIGDKDLGICISCIDNYYLDYLDEKCKTNLENNEFKYCSLADNGICIKCIKNYKLGLDNKCYSTSNCSEGENGICLECIDNYYLGLDNRCSEFEHCIYSNENLCLECDKNYYFNRLNQTCLLEENNFKNCKFSSYSGLLCEGCKNDFYLNKTDNLCYNNNDKNGKFYKCSKTDELSEFCSECDKDYYLGYKDKKCSKIYGCVLSENENKCIECDEYYCLNVKSGICEYNDQIYEEEKKFYFKCNRTNEEGNRCEICNNGYTLNDFGLCVNEEYCIEKNENGLCQKCLKFGFDDDEASLCLNNYFGCIEIYGNNKCIECNNILDFYNCSKCEDSYKIDENGLCEEIE